MQFIWRRPPRCRTSFLADLLKNSSVPIKVFRNLASEVMAASDLLVVKSAPLPCRRRWWHAHDSVLSRAILDHLPIGAVADPGALDRSGQSGRRSGIVPELIHDEATPERLAHETVRLLTDRSAYDEMKTALRSAHARR